MKGGRKRKNEGLGIKEGESSGVYDCEEGRVGGWLTNWGFREESLRRDCECWGVMGGKSIWKRPRQISTVFVAESVVTAMMPETTWRRQSVHANFCYATVVMESWHDRAVLMLASGHSVYNTCPQNNGYCLSCQCLDQKLSLHEASWSILMPRSSSVPDQGTGYSVSGCSEGECEACVQVATVTAGHLWHV